MPKPLQDKYFPWLTDEMIEQQAQSDLIAYQRKSGKSLSYPLFPEEIAKALWGVEVIFEDSVTSDTNEEVLASFVPAENKIYFNMSSAGSSGRSSFTMAHEVGHVSLHKFLSGIKDSRGELCRGSVSDDIGSKGLEKQADKYAGALLMPRIIMLEQMRRHGKNPTDTVDIEQIAKEMKDYFGVSRHALENRLINLGFGLKGAAYQHKAKRIPDSAFISDEVRAEWS